MHQFGAFVDAGLDQPLDLVELRLADHRAELGAVIARIADHEALGRRAGDRLDFVMPVGWHEHARGGVAGLAAVAEHARHALDDGAVQIDVGQQDVGRLAAEFLCDALDRRGRGLGDQDAGAGRAGERHHVNIRMC